MENHVDNIARTIGHDAIAYRLGVTPSAVRVAVSRGSFPASWYAALSKMCAAAKIKCPVEAFNFRSPSTPDLPPED